MSFGIRKRDTDLWFIGFLPNHCPHWGPKEKAVSYEDELHAQCQCDLLNRPKDDNVNIQHQ